MGTNKNGILGIISGKVGNIVGSTWKGRQVFRSRPVRRKDKKPSALQLEQRAKFILLTNFLLPLKMLFNLSFAKAARNMTGFNKAVSENKDAITGVYPNISMDYPKVILSRGNLENVHSPKAVSIIPGQLLFAWMDNTGTGNTRGSDFNFVAAFFEDSGKWVVADKKSTRKDQSYAMDVSGFSGKTAQVYIMSASEPVDMVSTSVYLGAVKIL